MYKHFPDKRLQLYSIQQESYDLWRSGFWLSANNFPPYYRCWHISTEVFVDMYKVTLLIIHMINYGALFLMINIGIYSYKNTNNSVFLRKILDEERVTLLNFEVNSSFPSAAYMRRCIGSALVQLMACRIYGTKAFSRPMLGYCQLDSEEQT